MTLLTHRDETWTGDHRPAVIAHRGSSADLAEHTLSAYERALEEGADGVECDVRLTADGHVVCVHDRTVDRTSNGRGVVSTLELQQLRDLDFASWKGAAGEDREHVAAQAAEGVDVVDIADRSVLTLERLLELVLSYDRTILMAIETKHPTRYAGWIEQRTVEVLGDFGLARAPLGHASPVRLMSFSAFAVRRFSKLAPDIPRVALMERVPVRFRDGTLPMGVSIAGPSIDIVRAHPHYPQRVRERGGRVFCWTVDEAEDVALCQEAGVDAIITNRPSTVMGLLA